MPQAEISVFARFVWWTALGVVAVDQITKYFAVAHLENQDPVSIVGTFVQLSFARNPGAAFSVGTNATVVFTGFAMIASAVIIRLTPRVAHRSWAIVFGAILGGALGNLIDRIFRSPGVFRGHVVDFIALPHYPMFNIADSAIFCAAVGGIILTTRGIAPLTNKVSS